MKKQIAFFLVLGILIFFGCQKEESFETSGTPSVGTLQSDTSGDCLPKNVIGTYEAGTALVGASNYIEVQVDVTTPGAYTIYTDTVNGYFFRGTGVFTSTGSNTAILRGNGTPGLSGVNNFVVHYNLQVCTVPVTVLPAGSGGPAVFTLEMTGGNCTPGTVAGTYIKDVALTSANTVTINVNVTAIGTYNISTTFQGMTFSKAGAFISTGVQQVQLVGSGTPTTAGTNIVPLTAGTSTCNFTVNVEVPGSGTLGGAGGACAPPVTINGTYTAGTTLTAGNTVEIQVNITTAGVVSIKTDTVANFSFSFTGNLNTGAQTITLKGSGNPSSGGTKTFTVTFGTSTCTFTINVGGASAGVGTLGGAPNACTPFTVFGTYTAGTILTGSNTVQVQVNVTTPGTFSITTSTVNGYSFSFNGNLSASGTVTLSGSGTPIAEGTNTFTVTLNGTPVSTCTLTVNVVAAPAIDYFPRTTNSNWSYEWDDDPTDSIYRYVIAATHNAAGNTFNIFMSNDGSGPDSSGYYRKSGGDYFEWFDFGSWVGYDNPVWGEYIMLKDNVPASPGAGSNWKTPVNGFAGTVGGQPISVRFSYTVTQKDVPISFTTSTGAMNFTNVIVVEEKLEAFDGANWIDITAQIDYYGKSYYARGIGLILFEVYDASNTRIFWMELRRHQVF